MGTAATTHFVTEAEFLALRESNQRIELIDGEIIVPPSSTFEHQAALGRMFSALCAWAAKQEPQPTIALAPLDVRFGPSRILQHDLMMFLQPLPRGIETPIARVPELVVEVLSIVCARSTTRRSALRPAGRVQGATMLLRHCLGMAGQASCGS